MPCIASWLANMVEKYRYLFQQALRQVTAVRNPVKSTWSAIREPFLVSLVEPVVKWLMSR